MLRVSVICGYLSLDITAEFACNPEVQVTNSKGNDVDVNVTWLKSGYRTVYPVQFECDVVKVIDRESLQAFANQHPDPCELRAALERLS